MNKFFEEIFNSNVSVGEYRRVNSGILAGMIAKIVDIEGDEATVELKLLGRTLSDTVKIGDLGDTYDEDIATGKARAYDKYTGEERKYNFVESPDFEDKYIIFDRIDDEDGKAIVNLVNSRHLMSVYFDDIEENSVDIIKYDIFENPNNFQACDIPQSYIQFNKEEIEEDIFTSKIKHLALATQFAYVPIEEFNNQEIVDILR